MAIDITYNREKALKSLERSKAFRRAVAKKKPVYSVHIGNTVVNTTSKETLQMFIEYLTPQKKSKKEVKEIKTVPLEEVNRLRNTMTLAEVIKKLDLDVSTNTLRVMLVNAGYIKTNAMRAEARKKRDDKIRKLYAMGFTFGMIKERLGLDLKESRIRQICKYWD